MKVCSCPLTEAAPFLLPWNKKATHWSSRGVWWCWKQSTRKARALLLKQWSRYSSLKLYRVTVQLQGNATASKQNTVGGRGETNHALITIKTTLTHFWNNTSISPATLITQRTELNILNKPAHNCLFPHSALIKVTSHQSFLTVSERM